MSSRRMPGLLLSLFVILAVTGLALLCIAVAAGLLQRAVRQAQQAAEQRQKADLLKQFNAATQTYHSAPPQPIDPTAPASAMSEEAVRERAIRYKDEWLDKNPDDAFPEASIAEVNQTPDGWHVVFEPAASSNPAQKGSPQELHIYIDPKGELVEATQGPRKAD